MSTQAQKRAEEVIAGWPGESKEAARLVVDAYGDPQESTSERLVWHKVGPWKRVVATRAFHQHDFPAPHVDAVESVIDYRVPPGKVSALTIFDGSVVVERTVGELSARCHDEEANQLALNLVHDIVTGVKTAEQAREYYAKEFLDHRRGKPTPYMDELRVPLQSDTADSDVRLLSDEELEQAQQQGAQQG
ncbi:MAG TPA: hypothetical protein VFY88_14215 [Intrasporangium sp.]|nr:hypothetical protein [Intrasporangium sp.]